MNAPHRTPHSATVTPTVPIAFQIGFGGSRNFFAGTDLTEVQRREIEAQLLVLLTDVLERLPQVLSLSAQHFLCGVSQVAIGADALFTRACADLEIPQRVFLPQSRKAYLEAASASGTPDFTEAERRHAMALLDLPHVIEERVVSDSPNRGDQFVDANMAISRAADIIIGFVRKGAARKIGGTYDLIDRAASLGKPALIIEVAMEDGVATASPLLPLAQWLHGQHFAAPGMPAELKGVHVHPVRGLDPDIDGYLETIRSQASKRSRSHSSLFKWGALTVLLFHVAATVLATLANKFHEDPLASALLITELAFLATGLGAHLFLHKGHAVRVWAVTRLVTDIMTSLKAVRGAGGSLGYAVRMAWDEEFLPLLRTCAILNLMGRRRHGAAALASLEARRGDYCVRRIESEKERGQLPYYQKQADEAERRHALATRAFWVFSLGAGVATLLKLVSLHELLGEAGHYVVDWGGFFAIALPVTAVGFLSWSAASDLEARLATFSAMAAFLERQLPQLHAATSDHEFEKLVKETETRLLSENLHWFSRRAFISVT